MDGSIGLGPLSPAAHISTSKKRAREDLHQNGPADDSEFQEFGSWDGQCLPL